MSLAPSKRPFAFLTYQAFKSREGIIFSKKSYWVIKDLGILDLKYTISLIGVQGDCEGIYTPSRG